MNRVEIVNLGGRARHIESAGAAAIDAWLEDARRRLNGDPDRDDLLLDFEQAIGEKCDAQLVGGRDVVTTEEVATILESLGTIEPSDGGEEASEAGAPPPPEDRPRRLYRIPDDRMVAGVCSGLAAWLRVDVTVMRVAWVAVPVLLLGLTDGASFPLSVGLYALLAVLLPRATSPEAKAAAYGYGATAQDLVMQARSGAMPALTTVGSGIGAAIRLGLVVFRVLLLIAITAVLAAWIVGAGWLAVAGDPWLTAFGDGVAKWLFPLFLTCAAVIAVAPLAATAATVDYALRRGIPGADRRTHLTAWLLSATAAWVAAITVAVLIVGAIPGMRDLWTTGEARIFFRGTTYCIVNGADEGHCEPGDHVLRDGAERRGPPPVAPRVPTVPAVPTVPPVPGVPTPGTR
ncbi:MAG: PspC domain-containing protein [Dehalococcoidia bacterium]